MKKGVVIFCSLQNLHSLSGKYVTAAVRSLSHFARRTERYGINARMRHDHRKTLQIALPLYQGRSASALERKDNCISRLTGEGGRAEIGLI